MNVLKIKVTMKRWGKVLISTLFIIIGCSTVNCYALDPPPITPIDEFFVVNHSGIPPVPGDWHLTVEGAVANPLALTLVDLMNYPATSLMATLECFDVSPILIGNANWTGVSLQTIIDEADPLGEAQTITFHALDGYSMDGFNLNDMLQRDDIILAYGMNGETLPPEQGYPLRLLMPGSYGNRWVQWIDRIEITTASPTRQFTTFPIHAKIFEPENRETITLGTHTISGIAFAGGEREVTKVEISTDGGTTWEPAQLLNYFVPNVWKLWEFTWVIPQAGEYVIYARGEDDLGTVQEQLAIFVGWSPLGIMVTVNEAAIPTLSEWGIIIFMTLIMGIGVVVLYRRRVV